MKAERHQALKRARKLRLDLRDRGEFTQGTFTELLRVSLCEFKDHAYDDMVENIARKVDEESKDDREPCSPRQAFLFQLDGELHLPGDRRIAQRFATLDHAIEAKQLRDKNLERQLESARRKDNEIEMLRPFWINCTKQEAVEAYYASQRTG